MNSTHSSAFISRKEEIEQQRLKWQTMEKRITGLVRKLKASNIQAVADTIMNMEDLITGRGPLCRAVMESQSRSSDVYAAFVAIINSKFPDVGYLLVRRAVLQFKEAYDLKDKARMRRSLRFLAHLINQAVVYEVLAHDILLLLLGNPSSDNTEVAVSFCLACRRSLLVCAAPRHRMDEIFWEFSQVLRMGGLRKRVQVAVVRLLAARRSGFKGYEGICDEVDDLVSDDMITHEVSLLHDINPETSLDGFEPKFNPGVDDDDDLNGQ